MDVVNKVQKTLTHKSLYLPYRVSYKDIFNDPQARAAAEAQGFLQHTLPADNIPALLTLDAIACARRVKAPTLIVIGEKDHVVQNASTRKVYDALAGEKEFYTVPDSGHSFFMDGHGEEAFEHIAPWLDAHLKN